MAETAVGFVIIQLVPLLAQEVKLLKGIHSDVSSIKSELESVQCFLKDADMRAEAEGDNRPSDGVKIWVKDLREVSFHIEDTIDEYILYMAQHPRRHGFTGSLQRICCVIIKSKQRHDIISQIQDIKTRVDEITQRSARYGFNNSIEKGSTSAFPHVSQYDPRKGALYIKEAEVVGMESPRDELIGWLLNDHHQESQQRTVISAVGMGGLGKTTLTKKVYDSVKQKFGCHAWIAVSQSYHKDEMLKDIIKQFFDGNNEPFPKGIDTMKDDILTNILREYLQQKRYVVVFDDVWQEDFWGDIEHALLDNQCGGKIVITTRNMKVAIFCKTSSFVHIHKIQPLHPEKAWELFCNKAFQFENDKRCPDDLSELSRKIVKRCQGLPLAIVAIGGLLSSKDKTVNEWLKLHDSLTSSEMDSSLQLETVKRILSLSYNDLPFYLKSCYLYLRIYPEDHPIRCSTLIRQWIAEGFVKKKTTKKTLEAVAEEYLTELINRSLVQVSEVYLDGKSRICRIHDLLRDVVLEKMEESSFCHVLRENESTCRGLKTRRLSLMGNCSLDVVHSVNESNQVRSILNFNNSGDGNSILGPFTKNFQLMKVLDFQDGPIDSLHEDIGNLYHLKYLSLRNTKVKMLPRSIGKLVNLETLDLKQSFMFEIPVEIKTLQNLRYILAYNDDDTGQISIVRRKGVRVQKGFGSLESLQKLYKLDAAEMGVEVIKELRKLTQLRRLGICKLRSEYGRVLCGCIEKMDHLEALEVSATSEDDMIDLESMSSPPQFLQRLYLYGRLSKLPEWIKKLQNLSTIRISWSKLEDDPLETFKNLPNLLKLRITRNAYVGDELQFEKGMFPKLKYLDLTCLSGLKGVVIEDGLLVNLENLYIGPSPQLKEVPSGIQHLKNLQHFYFVDMSKEFIESMKPGGQRHEIVQHVPHVLIGYTRNGGKYKTFRLF